MTKRLKRLVGYALIGTACYLGLIGAGWPLVVPIPLDTSGSPWAWVAVPAEAFVTIGFAMVAANLIVYHDWLGEREEHSP